MEQQAKHPKRICEGVIITDVHTNEKFEIKKLQPHGLTLEKVTSIGEPFSKEISYEELVNKWKQGGISITNYDSNSPDDIFILELCFDNIKKGQTISGYENEKTEKINKEKIRRRVAEAVALDVDSGNVEEMAKGGIINPDKGNYVVSAFDKNKGYRVDITVPQSKQKSQQVAKKYRKDMKIAVDKYKVFSEIKVENTKTRNKK